MRAVSDNVPLPELILATEELIVLDSKGVVSLEGFFDDISKPTPDEIALFEIELGVTWQEYQDALVNPK